MNDAPHQAPYCAPPDPDTRPPSSPLPVGACDTHAHVFGPAERFPYQSARAYTPPDASPETYRRMLHTLGFSRAVLIQPSVYGTDNSCMLDALERLRDDAIEWRGIAVLDETIPDAELERLHGLGIRGIRMNLVFPGGVDTGPTERLAERIADLGWHVQFLVDVSRFEAFADYVSRFPVDCVVDHMGHMPTFVGLESPGFQALLALMSEGRTWVKLSGPNRITSCATAPFTDVDPYLEALKETRIDRCLFGTDWPHVQLPTAIPNDGDLVDEFMRNVISPRERRVILVDNPAALYGF